MYYLINMKIKYLIKVLDTLEAARRVMNKLKKGYKRLVCEDGITTKPLNL